MINFTPTNDMTSSGNCVFGAGTMRASSGENLGLASPIITPVTAWACGPRRIQLVPESATKSSLGLPSVTVSPPHGLSSSAG